MKWHISKMKQLNEIAVVLIAIVCCVLSVCGNSANSVMEDERYRAGKERYELLKKESSMPKYSKCWTSALSSLDSGCKELTDDIQHRLALKFTNCFLMKTGREVYECEDTEGIDICTAEMKPEAYNTYTEFFTHTQNICFFLQAQNWQEATEFTIEKLSESSASVAKQIEDSSELQTEVIKRQNESIENQKILIERGQELRTTLEESKVDVHHMIQEFKDSTTEQRILIFEVFERLNSLQSVVLGEFTGFYSMIFYAVSILVCYLLTSTPRTSSARFWLFVIMTANIIVERLLVSWGTEKLEDPKTGSILDENSEVYRRLWLCRKLFSGMAFLTWIRCAYKYCDLNKVNNELLVEIRKQNSDLKHLLQGPSTSPSAESTKELPCSILNKAFDQADIARIEAWDASNAKQMKAITSSQKDSSTTGYESDSETDTLSINSFNSMMTDRTFTVTHHLGDLSESDTESFCTTTSIASLREELRDLRSATPLRDMSWHSSAASQSKNPSPTDSVTSTKSKRGRPKGSKNKQTPTRGNTTPTNSPCQYNLRTRSSVAISNPVVNTETAEDFGQMVRHLAKVAQRNRAKAEITVERAQGQNSKFFSSDEDCVQ